VAPARFDGSVLQRATWRALVAWYAEHLHLGGKHDATMDDLIGEMMAEDAAGGYSYRPGTA